MAKSNYSRPSSASPEQLRPSRRVKLGRRAHAADAHLVRRRALGVRAAATVERPRVGSKGLDQRALQRRRAVAAQPLQVGAPSATTTSIGGGSASGDARSAGASYAECAA